MLKIRYDHEANTNKIFNSSELLPGDGIEQTTSSSKVVHAQKIEPLTVSELNEYVITAHPQTIYCLDLRPQLSLVGLEKVSIDTNYSPSIDTPFSPSIDATTELSIDVPSSKLYRAGHIVMQEQFFSNSSWAFTLSLTFQSVRKAKVKELQLYAYKAPTSRDETFKTLTIQRKKK
ncbi:hypothetical protein YC2023_051134 [Brassica napus]